MPAKKKATRLDAAPLESRPLNLTDLSGDQRRAAEGAVREHGRDIPAKMAAEVPRLRAQADRTRAKGGEGNAKTYESKANRYERVGPQIAAAKRPASNIENMASRQAEAVKLGATTHRLPGESLAGTGWYLDANQAVAKEVPAGFDMTRATTASSILSVGAKPEQERASMGAAAHAVHHDAKVTMTGTVHAHLASQGITTPHAPGEMVRYRDLDGPAAAALADTSVRSHMKATSPDVDWDGLSKVANTVNRAKAHDVLTGRTKAEEAQSPITAPKTSTYTRNIAMASSSTPADRAVGSEYRARGAHLGDLVRGDVPKGQEMLDLWGKRHSEEGILNPKLTTPQDSWQMGIQHIGPAHPELMKAAGDVTLGTKTYKGQSAARTARVTPQGVAHAVHDAANQRAAQQLTEQYRPGYSVPSQLVQETGWTGARRAAGGDAEYNAAARETAAGLKEQTRVNRNLSGQQMKLF